MKKQSSTNGHETAETPVPNAENDPFDDVHKALKEIFEENIPPEYIRNKALLTDIREIIYRIESVKKLVPEVVSVKIPYIRQLLKIMFLPQETERVAPQPNKDSLRHKKLVKVLQDAFGCMPHLPDGVEYENRLRSQWAERQEEFE